ncbi:Pentatricopeptide repeat-containing protein [Camellia lanceoleosa]|nr:Pentatricopeptide repeat-containing protein [Camellia lanceoleosa]
MAAFQTHRCLLTQLIQFPPSLPSISSLITRILVRAKMFPAIDSLHRLLLSQPLEHSHTSLITVVKILAESGYSNVAISQFQSIRTQFPAKPNSVSFYNLLIESSLRENCVDYISWLYKDMIFAGFSPDTYTFNLLIGQLCDSGRLEDARKLFDKMPEKGCLPNEFSFGILVRGYCIAGLATQGLELLDAMKGKVLEANNILHEMGRSSCYPTRHTCNILLHSLWKKGNVSEAENLLQKMKERDYGLDTVTCNIVIDGLCKSGKVDKAIKIVSEMWSHGSDALGDLGNSFIGILDDGNNRKKCLPDLVSYSIIINGLCKNGRLDEAKKKFIEMIGKNLYPDSVIYNTFIDSFCKNGKISSAFRVLKDMEKKGCNKSLQTYNSLILGLGSKNQIFEMYGLMDEMKEKGVSPNVCTYNNMISCLCEIGRIEDATSLLNEMLQRGISPNISSFGFLIKASSKAGEFGVAREVFDIARSICGHKEALYSLMFNELLAGGDVLGAKALLEAALDRYFDIGSFLYKDLIDSLCKDENLEGASDILKKMIYNGYGFDPASFMPVIDGLGERGNKREAAELAEKMLEMASEGKVANKVYRNERELNRGKPKKYGGNDWQTILHRDEGSGIAVKTLKRVQKGWGQGSISSLHPQKNDFFGSWDGRKGGNAAAKLCARSSLPGLSYILQDAVSECTSSMVHVSSLILLGGLKVTSMSFFIRKMISMSGPGGFKVISMSGPPSRCGEKVGRRSAFCFFVPA